MDRPKRRTSQPYAHTTAGTAVTTRRSAAFPLADIRDLCFFRVLRGSAFGTAAGRGHDAAAASTSGSTPRTRRATRARPRISWPACSSAKGLPSPATNRSRARRSCCARLKATVSPPAGKAVLLLHHMDVVPADRSQWKMDPFSGTIQGPTSWGRGSLDMKGQGVAQLVAFLELKRQRRTALPRRDSARGTRRGSRRHDGRALDDRESLRGARSRIRDRRRRLREPRPVRANKLVYGIAVAEKKLIWLKVRAEGVAGHGSQPNDQNPNDRLAKALGRLLGAAAAVERFQCPHHDEVARRHVRREQVHERDHALDHLAHLDAIRRRRAAEDQRDSVGRRSRPRLPRAAGHDARSMARRGRSAASAIRR